MSIDFNPDNPDLVKGERLGLWQLLRPRASLPGGRLSGNWWLARHAHSGESALLLAYADAADAGAVLLRMAQAESHEWQHPDLHWPLDSGLTADGRPYVVMPALDGEPLLVAAARASLRRRLDWLLQLIELLQQAQLQGLELLELDPTLVWVSAQGQVRLQALALVPVQAPTARLGDLQGQVCRAAQRLQAPEHPAAGAPTPQAQVYRIGQLMNLLVAGRLPGEAESAQSPAQLLAQWMTLNTATREALAALLHRAVEADPARRPADLSELATAIAAWQQLAGDGAATGPIPFASSGPLPLDEAVPEPVEAAEPPAPPVLGEAQVLPSPPPAAPAPRRWPALLLGGALLLAVLAALWGVRPG